MAGIFPELMKDMFTHTMALIRINKYISKSIVRECKRQEGLKATWGRKILPIKEWLLDWQHFSGHDSEWLDVEGTIN